MPRNEPDEYRPGEPHGVAVIGMACRFPGAETPAQFWSNLVDGRESISREDGADGWIRASSTLADIDRFDAEFFGFSPREAALLDPQHRLFLEVCWEALEDGGAAGRRRVSDVGVYGGCGTSLYLMNNLSGEASRSKPNYLDSTEDLQLTMASDRDYLTSRVSYKLGFDGPSVNVQAACATSLYALHLACQALLASECDMALAGGAHVPVPQIDGYRPEPGLVLSQDGHCRAFDARATGTVFGSGVGVVLLKPLDRALADNDRVYAVIRGTAVNNDGSGKPGFSTPSVAGQAAVIRQALAAADVEPGSISYVEAHGTATPVGDPIEVAALTDAFRGARPQSCALGSVKTNIGHLSWAGGIAGVIKVALALWHRTRPASLHFTEPNPAINFVASPFFVQTETADWPTEDGPRRAGVSAFGLGGTNAHAVLEEAPTARATRNDLAGDAEPGIHVLPISGRTEPALRDMAARTSAALLDDVAPAVADAAFSLGSGRRHFAHRAAVVGSDRKTLAALLDAVATGQVDTSDEFDGEIGLASGVAPAAPRLTMLFSGQGAEYLEGCRDLYLSEPFFHGFVDDIDPHFRKHTGHRLSDFLYQDGTRRGMPVADIRMAQPVVYALQAALLELWRSWGVTPEVHIGHSLGEYAAAYGAAVFDLETGLYLVSERARLISTLPESGAMASILAGQREVLDLLDGTDQVDIAALNSPNSTVISGDSEALNAVIATAARRGVKAKKLRISRAAHSSQMDAILDDYAAVVEAVDLRPPKRTIISTLTGAVIGDEIANAAYWRRQLRRPVRFLEAIRGAAKSDVLLEIGLSDTLTNLAQMTLGDDGNEPTVLETLRWERNDVASTRLALAGAYAAGVTVDWEAVSAGGHTVTMPTYPFQRRRHWISSTRSAAGLPTGSVDSLAVEDGANQPEARETGHYVVTWVDAQAGVTPAAQPLANKRCLLIAPSTGSATDLERELTRLGAEVLVHVFSDDDDAAAVMAEFRPVTVVNAVPALRKRQADLGGRPLATESVSDDVLAAGGLITLRTYQAVSAANLPDATVFTVTSGAHRILTSDDAIPAQGAVVGIARTARTEFSTVRHVLVDLDAADTRHRWAVQAAQLAAAIGAAPAVDAELALRGDRVLIPRLRPGRVPAQAGQVRIDPACWYLVTGGLSGVGLECAHALLELGAKKLVLGSRSAPGEEREERVLRLRRQFDADIRTEIVDVTSPQQVNRLFAEYSGVRGVIHAAGVIDDAIMDRTEWSRMSRVLGPKAQGAWNLHRGAAEHAPDLDLFVMTSSYGGLFGNPGQAGHAAASTFLDALAGRRRAAGLPGLSLDLGSWSDVGILAGNDDFLRRLAEQGIGTISAAQGRPAVRAAIAGWSSGQVAILPTHWDELDPDHHLASNPILNGLIGDRSVSSTEDPSPAMTSSADIMAYVRDVVARVLGFGDDELTGLDLAAAGMDSLNALTIRNKLQQRLSVPLPATICFEKPKLCELAAEIEKRMAEVRD
ncbi:type I polyketide synthase [Amycolatopsis vastitatis]|uniref:Uncharacterized protein n=1 Tax=Amycolatopsis vastitatis TaxID=1905142 RepID=A0A229SQG5_9PSEU|nr:type I polyketide synthase [Amycolatopsis vastitatis]OXM61126.1 hypothetical protein CF165_39380 [Amycolatopsis vastitatis]